MSTQTTAWEHGRPGDTVAKERVLSAFEDAWVRGERPDLDAHLPADAERLPVLVELIHIDLERRLKAREPARIETYLQRYPELAGLQQIVLDLIAAEYDLRQRGEPDLAAAEYLRRFPDYREELLLRLDTGPLRQTITGEARPKTQSALPGVLPGTVGVGPAPQSSPSPAAQVQVPGYEIIGELGRGAMGVVYQARQVGLNRLVALKMILAGAHAGAQELARFRTEAEAIARLQHPHIVQVYEIHEQDGLPCFSLEYVDGDSLAAKLQGAAWPARQAAQLVATLAAAMHAAHQRGIIHRDLKPGNILLTRDGVPKITDFGLAKRIGSEEGQTVSGAILGTPSYMAPEQAEGLGNAIGPCADVYALGAILYELLTARPPFRAATIMETLRQVLNDDPTPPSRLSPSLPRDLETICLKCLHKSPARRYPSAEALANDLRAFLAGEPIQARPSGWWEQLLIGARRRPVITVLAAVAVVALFGLGVGLFLYDAVALSSIAVLVALAAVGWHTLSLRGALREAAEQRVRTERQVERVNLLLEMTRNLMAAPSLDELLRRLSETTTRLVNAERATIFLIDWDRGQVWSRVALGNGVGEIRLALGQGIAGTVALTGETINLADAYADPRFNPEVDRRTGFRTRSLLAMPMTAQSGKIMGVFQVLNKREGSFLPEDVAALTSLAASAMVAVEKARE